MMNEPFQTEFWSELLKLREEDRQKFDVCELDHLPRCEVISRIEDVIVQVTHQISTGVSPFLQLRDRHNWENVVYIPDEGLQMRSETSLQTVSFGCISSVEKFGLTLKVLSMIYKLLQTGEVATKRDLYYEEPQLFRSQAVIDRIVDDIACMLDLPRRWLNVVATSKGCVAGDLTFSGPEGQTVDCSQASAGVLIPTLVDMIDDIRSQSAKFILIVEKDATFQRLQDDCFASSMQAILITGKGVPDVNTRIMIKKVWNALQIPVLGLMDADPHGVEIMCVYRFGSLSRSYDSRSLALPFMRWIGIFPSDIQRLHMPDDVVMPLTSRDEAKCRDLSLRPYISHHPQLHRENIDHCRIHAATRAFLNSLRPITPLIQFMATTKQKAEIQALARFSSKYLSQVFIPCKIKHGDWI